MEQPLGGHLTFTSKVQDAHPRQVLHMITWRQAGECYSNVVGKTKDLGAVFMLIRRMDMVAIQVVEYYRTMKTNELELHVSTWKTLECNMEQPCGHTAFMRHSSMSSKLAESWSREGDGLLQVNVNHIPGSHASNPPRVQCPHFHY